MRFILILVLTSIACLTTCQSQNPNNQYKAISDHYPKLDTLFRKLVKHDKMHGAVAVSKNGELKHYKAYGNARMGPDDSVKASAKTRYPIGSITKTFTATLALQLIEEGKLSLDTKLAQFYPNLPNADSITIEQMLRHQSGLYNYTDSNWMKWRDQARSKAKMIKYIKKHEPRFSPGDSFQYSNTNYLLMGYIIEDLTGKTYRKVLKKRITEPLGLANTYFPEDKIHRREARSYRWENQNWDTTRKTNPQMYHAAGALFSTASDLVSFYRNLFQGNLLDSQSLKQMTKTTKSLGPKNGYGLGIFSIPFGSKTAYGHNGGGIEGFQAQAAYFPEDSIGIAITSNALNYPFNQISIGLLSIIFDRDYEMPSFDQKAVALSDDRLKAFTGFYTCEEHPLDITLRYKKGDLMAQATGQPAFPLTPISDTAFKYDRAGLEIRFKPARNDTFEAFYLLQNGKFLFKRKAKE